ncbi:MAG: hemolysin family protein [Ardenticatenia bacterium]|nr:hemolysin family protein [Ardenticatenia bacterium]
MESTTMILAGLLTFGVPIAIIAVLIFLNGLFVAAEFALVAAPRARLTQLAEQGSKAAQHVLDTLRHIDRQNLYLATAQVGITVVSLGLGMYGEHTVAEWLEGGLERVAHLAEPTLRALASALAVGVLTYFHVVVGEMVPKSIALQSADRTAIRLVLPMRIMQKLLWPIVTPLNAISNLVMHVIGVPPPGAHAHLFSPEELEYLVEESYRQGMMARDKHLFIENIFDLRERTVGHVMTPRPKIVGLPVGAERDRLVAIICEHRFSRYPVYEDDLDHIVGVLHVKMLARWLAEHGEDQQPDLRRLAHPAHFVPETLSLTEMLTRFRKEPTQMAIVFDEFGGTAGLITLEDVVEEVLGEIEDEFIQETTPPFRELAPGRLIVRGDVLLQELQQLYDVNLEHPEADTVSGLIMAVLGKIPEVGDEGHYRHVHFTVQAVDNRAVQAVLLEWPADEEQHLPGDAQPSTE